MSAARTCHTLAAMAILAAAGCTPMAGTQTTVTPAPAPVASQSPWPPGWAAPSRNLTPGATATGYGLKDICPHVSPALEAARPSASEKRQVYQRYGITSHQPGQYEIDHLIPVELLGAPDSPGNLWPELNDVPDLATVRAEHLSPAFVHNSKDVLEDVLHAGVCSGRVPLATAQAAITQDWRAAYVRYVGKIPAP